MAVIGSFNSRLDAEVAASMLESSGIPAIVVGDDAGGTAGLSLAAGGYRLTVPDDNRADAEALLAPAGSIEEPTLATPAPASRRPVVLQVIAYVVLAVVLVAVLSELIR